MASTIDILVHLTRAMLKQILKYFYSRQLPLSGDRSMWQSDLSLEGENSRAYRASTGLNGIFKVFLGQKSKMEK